jgi:hypothetical protein
MEVGDIGTEATAIPKAFSVCDWPFTLRASAKDAAKDCGRIRTVCRVSTWVNPIGRAEQATRSPAHSATIWAKPRRDDNLREIAQKSAAFCWLVRPSFWYDRSPKNSRNVHGEQLMPKNQRKLNRANHGKRPASSKARKLKRAKIKT